MNNGTFVDSRDNHSYKTITLGSQEWMAENLAFMPHVSPEKSPGGIWVYGYDGNDVGAAACSQVYREYGCLYDQKTASKSCPDGWRLPSSADYKSLLGGDEFSMHGRNYDELRKKDGFNAVLGGFRYYSGFRKTGDFSGLDVIADYWTSTPLYSDGEFEVLYVDRKLREAYLSTLDSMGAASVRCIRDR